MAGARKPSGPQAQFEGRRIGMIQLSHILVVQKQWQQCAGRAHRQVVADDERWNRHPALPGHVEFGGRDLPDWKIVSAASRALRSADDNVLELQFADAFLHGAIVQTAPRGKSLKGRVYSFPLVMPRTVIEDQIDER